MSLATWLATYTKFTPKQEATMLAILHVPSANWPCRTDSYRTWGAYTTDDDVNVPAVKLASRVWPCETSLAI